MYAVARRYSLCDDDAHDAVQAAAERFLRSWRRVRSDTASGWLMTVAKREALRIRERRVRTGTIEPDDDRLVHLGAGPDELVAREEEIDLAREALGRLKRHERLALWMQAEGRSYDEIAEELSWTRTKVNRNLTEGRARLRRALSGIEMGEGCGSAGPRIDRLAAGTATAEDLEELRPHVRRCAACRGRLRRARGGHWSLLPPVVVAWLPWLGRAGGAGGAGRPRLAEALAERIAVLLPAGAGAGGAVTEAGLAIATGAAVAALGAGVVAGAGGSADDRRPDPPPPSSAVAEPTARAVPALRPLVPVPVAGATVAPAPAAPTPAEQAAAVQRTIERAEARRAAARRAARRAAVRRAAARRARERRAAARRRAARSAARPAGQTASAGAAGPTAGTSSAPSTPAPVAVAPPASSGGSSAGGPAGAAGGTSSGGGSAADEFGFE